MSLSASADKWEGSGSAVTQVQQVPKLVAGGYAAWRPQMENVLMRAGMAERDYKEENEDWPALVTAVEQWTRTDEQASIDYALGRASASSSSKAGPSAAEKEARRGAIEAVARTKRAYALLYQALADDLRRLVATVPQGYAFGLWSWLEKRFQSTEQDNVGDLWDEFTKMEQQPDETFDEYKARVDQVNGLLAHAKDKPSPGLYTHRLLWKLQPQYKAAVLALKASGKLKEPAKIDWEEIVAFINNHERSEQRLNGRHEEQHAMAATRGGRRSGGADRGEQMRDGPAMRKVGRGGSSAMSGSSSESSGNLGSVECYNCGERGHLARNCQKPRGARLRASDDGESERASAAIAAGSSDSELEEEQDVCDVESMMRATSWQTARCSGRGGSVWRGRHF